MVSIGSGGMNLGPLGHEFSAWTTRPRLLELIKTKFVQIQIIKDAFKNEIRKCQLFHDIIIIITNWIIVSQIVNF